MKIEGLSREGLSRLHKSMTGYVERGEVPGILTLVSRHGEVSVDAVGKKAFDGPDPMRRDTIFRIASMSKPITAAATMILVEEGKLRLSDAVEKWLPELANRKVLKRIDAPLDETVPAQRPITVRDLLTFTMGFGLLLTPTGEPPILKAANELQIGIVPSYHQTKPNPEEWLRRLGTLPLMAQPGERWLYGIGSDVLSVLIARICGQPLETFLRERIFEPLGMKDTGFSVPADKLDRLASCYFPNPATGTLELFDGSHQSRWGRPPTFPSGANGLVSTLDDYLAFGQMLLSEGKHGSERILSRLSVEAMTTDQLTPAQKAVSSPPLPGFFETYGWGFGVSVVTRRDDLASVPGRYGWDGGLGTSWFSDPKEDLIGIVLTQRLFPLDLYRDFWTLAYQAIAD
ncbi:class A beta-lactamase-related serine hydrolase [Ktedonosporobacter rubrisoli]|uniref:Class A beta-lactamase-related serine hydrolase n=1 Tax=Ktedonosporobacter rubrisoli TaxID=2509675 RepID=A0A4V0YYR6_KTERU|nr:serine hydrolase domain-containing protein [Ktedonosporobacter rubrisoli]QBD77151.1 class A beta-lactamase-related serine hydrolase [Ktedonosporobacter rubrisoli]